MSKQHLYILCLHKTDLLKRGNFSLTPQIWQTFNLGPQINLDLCTSLMLNNCCIVLGDSRGN